MVPLWQVGDVCLEEEHLALTHNSSRFQFSSFSKPARYCPSSTRLDFYSPAKVFVGRIPSGSLFLTTLTTNIPPNM